MRILVVEDELRLANALKAGLENEFFEVVFAHTGKNARLRIGTEKFDLVLMDLTLPDSDGISVLKSVRKSGVMTPIVLMAARDSLEDKVAGLNTGADDYLVKPVAFPELLARMRALLRRGRQVGALRLRLADLSLDLVTRKVVRGNRTIDVTVREFQLLEYLLRHQGAVVSREMLGHEVWKKVSWGTALNNVMDVHIARLRQKIDLEQSPKLIHTVRGLGFLLSDQKP
jgi:two-component system, OmpR family, copper resistance phosphate regulon response regulator CusR